MKKIIFLTAFFSTSSAFASTYAKCGRTADLETFEVTGYELELSSESEDYSGPVGETWNLKLGSESSDWLDSDRTIVARSYEWNLDTIVEVTLRQEGTRYKLVGLYDEEPTLEKTVAGSDDIEIFHCVSGND